MNRKDKFLLNILLLGVCFHLILSCKVGLGESVDTKAPDVSISYPPANSYVKGTVAFSGTASDDEYLDSVSLSFKRTDAHSDSNPVFNASLDRSAKTWTCSIETGDDKKVLMVYTKLLLKQLMERDAIQKCAVRLQLIIRHLQFL